MATTINLIRNVVEDSISLIVPDEFVEDSSHVVRINSQAAVVVTPTMTVFRDMDINMNAALTMVATTTPTGPTVLTISTTAADCYILTGINATFSATDTVLGMGTYAVQKVQV